MSRTYLKHDPWWHVAGLSLGFLFALMLMGARLYPAYFDAIDRAVEGALLQFQTLEFTQFFLAATVLGNGPVVAGLTLAAAYLLRRNSFAVLQLFLVMLFASVSMGIAKTFVERTRPETLLWLDPLNSYSFPSGHATLSTASSHLLPCACIAAYEAEHCGIPRALSACSLFFWCLSAG